MDCRIVRVEQGSAEWLDLRRTRITASRLADVMSDPAKCKDCKATGKTRLGYECPTCKGTGGILTKRYRQYRREKVLELLGNKSVEETPEWAEHGKENEGRALGGYEWRYGLDIEHNVFLIHKEFDWLAASPDFMHLPDYDEGGEVKCRALYKNYRKFKREAELYQGTYRCIPAADRHQVQGAMWLTGFKFWHYVNYYIGSDLEGGTVQKIHRIAVPRNQALIDKMQVRCIKFMKDCYARAELEFESR